jgi:glycosyltransferase involved in cell wall biosynthesis
MRILIDGQTLLTPEINRGIGMYFRKTIQRILANNLTDDFFIAGTPEEALSCFSPWTRQRLQVLRVRPGQTANAEAYADGINEIIERHRIGLYWSPNPLMLNVLLPVKKTAGCVFAATIFDLIPAVMEMHFRKHWPARTINAYKKKLQVLENHYDLFLHISGHTQSDFLRMVGGAAEKLNAVTPLAADEAFRPYAFPGFPGDQDYVLYPGGFDPRKNMDRALEAFAAMKNKYSAEPLVAKTALVIVCHKDAASEGEFRRRARKLGIDDHVKLTGFVTDTELVSLYQKARCLFFPSLYEGFGLPVLEGLACGLPIAASNNSSIPEVAGDLAFYFDPYDIDDMAAELYCALNAPRDLDARLKRSKYAQNFSWRRTALATIDAWNSAVEDNKSRAVAAICA